MNRARFLQRMASAVVGVGLLGSELMARTPLLPGHLGTGTVAGRYEGELLSLGEYRYVRVCTNVDHKAGSIIYDLQGQHNVDGKWHTIDRNIPANADIKVGDGFGFRVDFPLGEAVTWELER